MTSNAPVADIFCEVYQLPPETRARRVAELTGGDKELAGLVHALIARDIPVVQGAALCMGLMFVLLSAFVDGVCWLMDPRLHERSMA